MDQRLTEAIRLFYVLCVLPYLAAIFALTVLAKNCGHVCVSPLILLGLSILLASALFLAALFLIKVLRKRARPSGMVSAAMCSQVVFLIGALLIAL